jgi:phage terminase large subunit
MTVLKIDLEYTPRAFQQHLHKMVKRFNILVLHRRAGKTVFSVHELIDQALRCEKKNPQYAYVAPTYTSAKRIVWDLLKQVALKIPGATANEAELRIDIPRPHTRDKIKIVLLGAENPAAIRGMYLDGVILDEAAFMLAEVWSSVIRPALSDREGWALFISTPNGMNWFADLYTMAKNNDDWFTYMLKASESGLIPQGELDAAKQMMSESEYAQEFECSFSASNVGSFWGKEIEKLEEKGQITSVPYEKMMGVQVFVDLGIDDQTAMWFVQQTRGGEVRVIDYHEDSGVGWDEYAKILQSKRYKYDSINLPHDAQVREMTSGKSRVEIIRQLMKGVRITVMPKYDVADSINAVRMMLPKCWFDADKTSKGLKAIKAYQRRYNAKTQTFEKSPLHDWSSHAADAMRYVAMGLKQSNDGADDSGKQRQRYAVSDFLVV